MKNKMNEEEDDGDDDEIEVIMAVAVAVDKRNFKLLIVISLYKLTDAIAGRWLQQAKKKKHIDWQFFSTRTTGNHLKKSSCYFP